MDPAETVRFRTINFLLGERERLFGEMDEVETLLAVLDYEPPPVKAHTPEADLTGRVVKALSNGSGPLTVQQVAARLDYSRSQVQKTLATLAATGRVERREATMAEREERSDLITSGRSPWLYTLVPVVEEREHALDEETRFLDH